MVDRVRDQGRQRQEDHQEDDHAGKAEAVAPEGGDRRDEVAEDADAADPREDVPGRLLRRGRAEREFPVAPGTVDVGEEAHAGHGEPGGGDGADHDEEDREDGPCGGPAGPIVDS